MCDFSSPYFVWWFFNVFVSVLFLFIFWLLGDELPCDMRIPSDKQDKLHGCLEHLFNQVSFGAQFGNKKHIYCRIFCVAEV